MRKSSEINLRYLSDTEDPAGAKRETDSKRGIMDWGDGCKEIIVTEAHE